MKKQKKCIINKKDISDIIETNDKEQLLVKKILRMTVERDCLIFNEGWDIGYTQALIDHKIIEV